MIDVKDEDFKLYHGQIQQSIRDWVEHNEIDIATLSLDELKAHNIVATRIKKELERSRKDRRRKCESWIKEHGLGAFYRKHDVLGLEKNFDTFDMIFFNMCSLYRLEEMHKV